MSERRHALRTPDSDAARRAPIVVQRPVVQRKCGCGGSCGSCSQSKTEDEKKKKIQRRALGGDTASEVPRSVGNVLGASGRPLDSDTRASMESRFGFNFAHVRVHTDTHAAESAKEIDAAAYTSGTHIVFGAGRFTPETPAGRRLLAHELAHVVQQRSGTALPSGVGPADDVHERAADRAADAVVAQGPAFAPPPALVPIAERLVRRKREEDEPASAQEEARRLIVEDSAAPAAGQMRRSQFVELLDAAVCATSREAMGRLGRSTEGCPLLEQWRPKIRAMGVRQLEISIRRWIGPEEAPRAARDFIPRITARLAESIRIWGAAGQITGVPPDLMDLLAPGKIKIGVGSMLRGAIGSLFRKSRDGAAAPAANVALDTAAGRPLDNGIASRMGRAFGHDFSGVRVHTGAEASAAAAQINARAFTVGSEIAFASGEFAPGTLVGDALLAHELAHVAQQDAGPVRPMGRMGQMGPIGPMGPIPALEHDADDAAVHAVASLWPNVRALLGDVRTNAMPRLKSSLQLQRCSPSAKEMRDYLTAVDTAKKPLEASGSAKKARHVIANWAEGSPDYLLTIRRKIVLIRQLLNDGPDGDGQEQILNLLEHTASPDLKLILGADGGIQHAELLDKFTSWKTELHRFYMRRYPDAYSAEVKGEQDVFGQREPAPQAPDRKLLESAEPTELPFSLVQFGDDIPKTTNPWRVTTQREMHPQEREAGRDTVKSWAVEVYGKYIPADAIKRAGAASLTYDPGENTQWEAFIVACMNLRQEKDRAVARAICDAEETSTAAFYERDSNAIQVHAKRDTPETLLHEVLHALSHERTQELGHYAMEGMTELFTRRVALKRKWRKGEKPIYLGGHYDLPYDAVQELAIAVGEDAIASAYFGGNLKALCEAMGGKAIFDAWNKAMEGRDNAPEATKILRRETPAPPVEGACT